MKIMPFPVMHAVLVFLLLQGAAEAVAAGENRPPPLFQQSQSRADQKSRGCLSCHGGIEPMHASPAVKLGCVDCHGGNETAERDPEIKKGSPQYQTIKSMSHVSPQYSKRWSNEKGEYSSANPERTYTLLNKESVEFIRFINPGDLRVAAQTCGNCHIGEVNAVRKSTMTTSAIFWGAAAYANGILPNKKSILGESYLPDGTTAMIKPQRKLSEEETRKGVLPFLFPLPRWEILQPGDNFRAFEDGGLFQPSAFPEIGNPNPLEEPGKPDIRLSNRGPGTGLRISIPVLNIHKTRLNDPHLSFLGTNDHPGDYRSSGCTACHVVYANDRDPEHSGFYSSFGHLGKSDTDDPTISKTESGHPIRHRLTRSIPSSQCMVCHMHQPNSFLNTYYGYNMWDYVTDGPVLWPEAQDFPTEAEKRRSLNHNPEGAAIRGRWTDKTFLQKVSELNPELQHTRFADYHGHGWVFRAVYKRDRKGNLLDGSGNRIDFTDPDRFQKAVHLKDIHLEKGMHCVDCHFEIDSHGNGKLHGEYGNAIEITCEDCHGTVWKKADLKTSGPAAPEGGTDLLLGTTPFGRARFVWKKGELFQRSMIEKELEWKVTQVRETVTPGSPEYNERSRYAKTLLKDGKTYGKPTVPPEGLAHSDNRMTCYTCHSSWMTSCFGCHLPQEANQKSEKYHFEGGFSRQYSSYNPQVVREDVFMLGINGTTLGNKIAPVRSSSALSLSSTNQNRQRFYIQQTTISTPGFSGQAFNPHVPHTVRTKETKSCSDCHLSERNDNNAWIAQLLLLGTNFVNFMGRFAWVAEGKDGFEAVGVTEWEEPQAVFGSYLHHLAFPDFWKDHRKNGRELREAHHHHGGGEVRNLVKRGEYLYAALGPEGFEVFDIANVDNKDFSERIVTAPVSPLGQRTYVRTRYATAVALPTNMPIAPYRKSPPENQEQPWSPVYHYAFVTDRHEGLILVNVDTLSDRDPKNNFFSRFLTFNPGQALKGAEALTIAGNYAYVLCNQGLVVIDIGTPDKPEIVAKVPSIRNGKSIAVQFRYAFITDSEGFKVVEITDPLRPAVKASLPLPNIHNVYVARTYAYVAGGPKGLIIIDIENPEKPFIDRIFDAEGSLNDTRDVQIASAYSSLFAYVADGKNGLRVLQLTSPETTPGYLGFSPRPNPVLIAARKTHGPAIALAKGLDRDRAVDESGNQISVFNRIGARPFNLDEMQRLYLKEGKIYRVSDEPPNFDQK